MSSPDFLKQHKQLQTSMCTDHFRTYFIHVRSAPIGPPDRRLAVAGPQNDVTKDVAPPQVLSRSGRCHTTQCHLPRISSWQRLITLSTSKQALLPSQWDNVVGSRKDWAILGINKIPNLDFGHPMSFQIQKRCPNRHPNPAIISASFKMVN